MSRTAFPLLLICCLFITSFSCSNKSNKSRKPVSTISIEPNKKNYVFGEKVSVNVKTKVKNGEIDKIQLFYQNQLIKESTELDFTVDGVEINTLGSSNFKVEAIKKDGQENNRLKTIIAFSDIQPEKFTYKTINVYPHSKNYFTEGLEFYKGFIYEGTGENGTSGIYKVDLKSGNTVQSVELNEKYFGEGITILNDKIYQLTYRAKKGFIYQLSNFALIDSFQFNSSTNEGWGLTNDGKNLIMSDGSQFLTWISTDDFSVLKRIEVGNNKAIYKYVNELEFVDGAIYANIYTTETIVKIDPENGRILSEISFPGIINMYQKAEDKIDYMNGIAYDDINKRFFITGKFWPKLFEVEIIPSK